MLVLTGNCIATRCLFWRSDNIAWGTLFWVLEIAFRHGLGELLV
jgi:hypothetical protein